MSNSRRLRRRLGRGPVLYVVPPLDDGMPALAKEGLARRRLVMTTGRCPCGATLTMPKDLQRGTITHVRVEHEVDCPAVDENLLRALG